MHYLLQVPEFDNEDHRPTDEASARRRRRRGGEEGVLGQAREPRHGARRDGHAVRRSPAVARHAQRARREVEGSPLRSRPAAQRDPLSVVGPEGSAHRVQAGSVHDVRGPDERHLQHVQRAFPQGAAGVRGPPAPAAAAAAAPTAPTKRYNALGILEDIPSEESASRTAPASRRGASTSDRRRRRDARRSR